MDPDASAALAEVIDLGTFDASPDAEARKKLRIAARKLSRALEEPGDVVERVCYQVRNDRTLAGFERPLSGHRLRLLLSDDSSWKQRL